MGKNVFYTLWLKVKGREKAVLLEDEETTFLRWKAFKRAKELAHEQCYSGCYILVRRIKEGSLKCDEWAFDCDECKDKNI